MLVYRRTKSGRVIGGPDLSKTAEYTPAFCHAVCNVWEPLFRSFTTPTTYHDSLLSLLHSCGFVVPRRSCSIDMSCYDKEQGEDFCHEHSGGHQCEHEREHQRPPLRRMVLLSSQDLEERFFFHPKP